MQAKLRNFYGDFGRRISFIREKRGLTLRAMADGKPSTAKSWEGGSRPGSEHWEKIAGRVGLSVSFVFLGQPTSREDYEFVAKYADEIGSPKTEQILREESDGPVVDLGTASKIRDHIEELIEKADGDPHRLGWLLEQLRSHVRAPAHWDETEGTSLHEEVIREVLEEEKQEEARRAHSKPPKAQGGAGR